MNTIRPASFRSSEKRKAKARRHSAADVVDNAQMSFGFSSASGDDSLFSPGFYATSIPSTVVKRFLLSNDLGSASSSPQRRAHQLPHKDTETPLFSFAYQHNTSFALADDVEGGALSIHHDSQLGLFGYSCTNDSSVASPLRQINGERGDAVHGLREPLLSSSASIEQLNIKKRLRYTPVQSSNDMSSLRGTHQPQLRTVFDTPIRSDSSSTDGHCGSTSSSTDGTVIDEWILEDQQADEEGHTSSPYEQELNNDIGSFEASFAHVLSGTKPGTTDQSLVKEAVVSTPITLVRDQNA